MKRFISNYFDEERLGNLEPVHPLCINSPPDSGKTTMMIHKICDCARKRGEKVVFLNNRRILARELQRRVLEAELEKEISDNCLLVLQIQSIEGNGKKAQKLREKVKSYKFICVDECHYFVQDA